MIIAVAVGLVLRVWQYVGASSLWFDEIALAKNVLARPIWDLVSRPLSEGFVATAPSGFLIVQKLATALFGSGDRVLRLWPFVASVVALLLFWRVATRSQRPLAAMVSVTLFALASPLVWQGAQAKQYSSDVLCTVVLLAIVQRLAAGHAPSRRTLGICAPLGALVVWISQPAVFVLFAVGLWLIWHAWRSGWLVLNVALVETAAVVCVWAVSALAAVIVASSMISPELATIVYDFWSVGFAPGPSPVSVSGWLWERLVALFGSGSPTVGGFSRFEYGYYGARAATLLAGAGGLALLARRHAFGMVYSLAAIVTVSAAALHRYPFDDRLILFLLPLLLLAIGDAIGALERLPRVGPALAGAAAIAIVGTGLRAYVVNGLPVYHLSGHVKPVLAYFDARREPGDEVYVTGLQSAPFAYYADQFGLNENGYVVGGCHVDRRSRERYLAELGAFRGKPRVWLLFSGLQRPIRDTLVSYLDANARRLDAFRYEYRRADNGMVLRVEAFLYDLTGLPPSIVLPDSTERQLCPRLALPAGRYPSQGSLQGSSRRLLTTFTEVRMSVPSRRSVTERP
jgi:hypothetical protein